MLRVILCLTAPFRAIINTLCQNYLGVGCKPVRVMRTGLPGRFTPQLHQSSRSENEWAHWIVFWSLILWSLPLWEYASTGKEAFFRQLDAWRIPNEPAHPRLYFDAKGLGSLRSKGKSMPQSYQPFIAACEEMIAQPLPDYSDFKFSRNKARNAAERLSFAYVLTGDQRYAERAKGIVQQMLAWPDWVMAEHKPRIVDLGVAGVANSIALCYDWLFPALSGKEKKQIEQALLQRAMEPFYRVYKTKAEGWTKAEHNWRSVICGEMGVTALAILEQVPQAKETLQFAIDGVVEVLEHGGADGDWNEGVGYWGYGIGQAVLFVHALYTMTVGEVDLYQMPFLQATGDFGLYMRTPEGTCFNFSDCDLAAPRPWLMAALAARYRNPYWQWSALKDIGAGLEDLLFLDTELTPQSPQSLPLGKYFRSTETVTMRSSWRDDAVLLGFKSGHTIANHSHLDLNSFVLHAFGRPLLMETETWPYAHSLGFFEPQNRRWDFESNATVGHNTLLVDGQGQRWGAHSCGHIIAFQATPALQYAFAEADSAYGDLLRRFRRCLSLVDSSFVLIVDDVAADSLRRLEWLMHGVGQFSEDSAGVFYLANGPARLEMLFLRPTKAENRVVSFAQNESSFAATYETSVQVNRYVSVRPLHRQRNYRFITLAFPYRAGSSLSYSAKVEMESDTGLDVAVKVNDKNYPLHIDLKANAVQLE